MKWTARFLGGLLIAGALLALYQAAGIWYISALCGTADPITAAHCSALIN